MVIKLLKFSQVSLLHQLEVMQMSAVVQVLRQFKAKLKSLLTYTHNICFLSMTILKSLFRCHIKLCNKDTALSPLLYQILSAQ